jgi:hypothetical protein
MAIEVGSWVWVPDEEVMNFYDEIFVIYFSPRNMCFQVRLFLLPPVEPASFVWKMDRLG